MKIKPVAIVSAVLILFVVLFIYYKNSQKSNQSEITSEGTITTSNETSQWQVYSNEEAGFEFSYPENWRFVNNLNSGMGGTLQVFNYPADKYIGGEPFQAGDTKIEFAILDNSENKSFQTFIEEISKSGLGSLKEHIYTKVLLEKTEATSDEMKDDNSYKSYFIQLKGNKVLVATIAPQTTDVEANLIISSIKVMD